jgi:hypothetical protein
MAWYVLLRIFALWVQYGLTTGVLVAVLMWWWMR